MITYNIALALFLSPALAGMLILFATSVHDALSI